MIFLCSIDHNLMTLYDNKTFIYTGSRSSRTFHTVWGGVARQSGPSCFLILVRFLFDASDEAWALTTEAAQGSVTQTEAIMLKFKLKAQV